ncbi:DUF3313 domain-containing protein [Acidisoma cladoniae]|jgi:hypothetical protein|uniref:DUF3313 domain-containing protein n=1 Tax=Acidisoma cladoniae TaxID=3040935 RepID=UPI00254D0C20|nr:DUF3313 domain-containing protein [Acidisoma sp. PAMC 29798]
MQFPMKTNALIALALCVAVAGCGTAKPVDYTGLASSAQLAPNTQDDAGRVPYRFSTPVDWRHYDSVVIDPVVIYRGSESQFGTMSDASKTELANYLQAKFEKALTKRFTLINGPAPNALRVRLTLTGAAASTPVLSTLTRFDISGGLYNGVQTVAGGEGMFTGSVIFVTEIFDSETNRLLRADITKQYPSPMNIMATMGSLAAAKTGIDKGADAMVASLK